MALTKVSYSMITGAPFNVLDFGANTIPGTTDMSVALQAAVTAAVAAGGRVYMPSGTYLITDTINCPQKTMITGEHRSTSGIANGTKILFQPTSVKNLFSTGVTVFPSFKDGYAFENLYIQGNSTTAAGNSSTAFDLINVLKSTFRNMRIDGFRVGFRVEATGNNRFEFIQLANHYLYCIHYTGAYASADLWENCRIGNSPIGVQTNGYNHAIVFNNCMFETIETYGVNLVKECYGWIFSKTYVEDVPYVNVATNCMFRVGYDGALLAGAPQLEIAGGNLFGSNGATQIGALLDVDFTDGVTLGGFSCGRFADIVKTSANTQTSQIVVNGWTAVSVSGSQITDTTKISGYYPISVVNSGTRNRQNASFSAISAGTLTFDSGASATTSVNLQLGRNTDTAVGGAGGASALPATPLGYLIAFIGATQIKIPYYNA